MSSFNFQPELIENFLMPIAFTYIRRELIVVIPRLKHFSLKSITSISIMQVLIFCYILVCVITIGIKFV